MNHLPQQNIVREEAIENIRWKSVTSGSIDGCLETVHGVFYSIPYFSLNEIESIQGSRDSIVYDREKSEKSPLLCGTNRAVAHEVVEES